MTEQARATQAPPPTRQDNVRDVIHGVEIVDPYRWLEEQESPETRTWIAAQNEHTRALLDGLPVRERIQQRLTELLKIDSVGAPLVRNGAYFFSKRLRDQDLGVLYRRRGLHGEDEVLLDPHPLSPDHTTSIGLRDVSKDGRILAYHVRQGGEDEVQIRFRDLETGSDLPDRLPRALYFGPSLTNDASGCYYALRRRDTGTRIYYHAMGTDLNQDQEVFGEGYGPDRWISAPLSEDGRYLLITVGHGWGRTEVYIQDLAGGGSIRPLVNDIDAKFYAWFAGDCLVMRTDWEAPNHRIIAVDLNNPARDQWREIVPEGPDAIQGFSLIGGQLFVNYLPDVTTRIRVFNLEGQALGEVDLPGVGSGGIDGRWDSSEAFLHFSSYTTPYTIYCCDVSTGERELWARQEVPVDPDRFEVRQVWYQSRDGTRVPMFLIHQKGLKPDGQRPTLLYGYGGFSVSLTPGFNTAAVLWAEQGGVYAVANLRGGSEFGEAWHRAGMLANKQNVFDDFIAAAEWLIGNGYTNPSKLAIQGGSNGGLLVGAALTQRPDLFQAVLCQFPDLDMVRYYQFDNNNPPALLEYGNASDPEQFKFLYAYSPYQRVKPGTWYPAVLLTSGDTDTRVPPLQARKMAARLQAATASHRPILLHYDTRAGHAGGKPFSRVVEDMALEQSFLFWQLAVE
jgi:prolyl oligopeptidase